MQAIQEQPQLNGNSLELTPREKLLRQLKAAAYDCHRQIQFLSQVRLPEIEQQIAQLEQQSLQERSPQ